MHYITSMDTNWELTSLRREHYFTVTRTSDEVRKHLSDVTIKCNT